MALKLGTELQEALPAKFGTQLDSQPIVLQPQDFPVVSPIATGAAASAQRQVCISAGLISLLNHLCHALAIDHVQPGYFNQYVENFCRAGPNPTPPEIVDARYWTDDILNDQMSYFNQMVGFIMALNLSHQYLGHYAKYGPKMSAQGSQILPINDFLTKDEWQKSFRAGALNSLNCALATDGTRALFDALAKLPTRPRWADYIVPPDADLNKLSHQLAKWETDFFHGHFN